MKIIEHICLDTSLVTAAYRRVPLSIDLHGVVASPRHASQA